MMVLPFLLPYHQLPIPSFESEWLAMMLGVAGLLVMAASRRGSHIALPPVALAPLALGLVVLFQIASGMLAYASSGGFVVAFLIWAAALAVAGRWAAATFGATALFPLLAWFVLAGGMLSALAGLAQYAGMPGALALPLAEGSGIYGNVAQQNHFATYTAMSIASLLYLRSANRIALWAALPAAALLLAALALSGSRSSVLYIGWIILLSLPARGLRKGLVPVAALAAAMALLWTASHFALLGPQLARLTSVGDGFGPRTYLWQHAVDMFLQHPWLGVGVDGFAHALTGQLKDGARVWGIDQYAHNLPLQLLATTGIAGFAAAFVPVAMFVARALRSPRHAGSQWGWAILGILAIHSMLEQPLYYAYFLGMAAFVAGAMDSGHRIVRLARAGRTALAACLCLACIALVKTASDYRALASNFYGPDSGDVRDLRHQQLLVALHSNSMFAPMAELIAPELFVAADAPVADRLAFNERVMRFAPIAEVEYRQAALLAEDGRVADAKRQFSRAALAYPAVKDVYVERFAMLAAAQPLLFGEVAAHAKTHGDPGGGATTVHINGR